MKRKIQKLTLAFMAAAAISMMTASAAEITYGYTTKAAKGGTTAEVIFPAEATKTIRLVSLDVTADNATNTLKILAGTERYTIVSNAAGTATNLFVLTNYNATAGDVIVVQKASDGSAFSLLVDSVEGTTNLVFAAPIGTAVSAGDSIYRMASIRELPVGNSTVRRDGPAVFAAPRRQPVLIRLTGASACAINNVTAYYDPVNY